MARLSAADAAARAQAACYLGAMALDALPALAPLRRLLADATPIAPVVCAADSLIPFVNLPSGQSTPGYAAARALLMLGNTGRDALIADATHRDAAVRRHVIRALLHLRDARTQDIFLAAITDVDPAVRADAARGLRRGNDPSRPLVFVPR